MGVTDVLFIGVIDNLFIMHKNSCKMFKTYSFHTTCILFYQGSTVLAAQAYTLDILQLLWIKDKYWDNSTMTSLYFSVSCLFITIYELEDKTMNSYKDCLHSLLGTSNLRDRHLFSLMSRYASPET